MKIINSELLYELINNGSIKEGTKFKVYKDDNYVTTITFNGYDFIWEIGTFTSGMILDPLVDFEIIEEEKEIEHYDLVDNYQLMSNEVIANNFIHINEELEWLVSEIKRLKEDK